jgi:hypothetical protein
MFLYLKTKAVPHFWIGADASKINFLLIIIILLTIKFYFAFYSMF